MKLSLVSLVLILLLAAFLRLWAIGDYMQFLGDEGRDAIVARGILHGHFTLLGPRSSAGDFFMGPFYYYLITPFLLLANYDPVGPAIMVALFGVATVFLIYIIGRKLFGQVAGLSAALLYAASPLVLTYSHSSWNPNVLPFFALLTMSITYLTVANNKPWKYYLLIGILIGLCLQLHYLSLFLAIIIGIYILLYRFFYKKKGLLVSVLKKYLLIATGAILSISPLIMFEFRHGFLNTKGIMNFIFNDTLSSDVEFDFFQTVGQVFFRIWARLIVSFPGQDNTIYSQPIMTAWGIFAMLIAAGAIIALFKHKNKAFSMLLILWLFEGVALLGLYKKEIYDYLFTFVFPLPFLLTGNLISYIYHRKKYVFKVLSCLLVFGILVIYYFNLPFHNEPNRQRDQAKSIAQFVIDKTDKKPYNFALISKANSDHAYRYYLDILDHPPVVLDNLQNDPKRKTVAGQLLVVCEDIDCKPLGNPIHEVAAFGQAEVTNVWNFSVVKIYRLVPDSQEK